MCGGGRGGTLTHIITGTRKHSPTSPEHMAGRHPSPRPLHRMLTPTSCTLTHSSAHRAMLTSHYLCYCNYIIRCFMQNYPPRTN